jgi:putative DNA primase/helicase
MGKLPSRFMVISNELPRLGDVSATIANRLVALLLRESWLGREDHSLETELHRELPGILNWSLDGLDRLVERDRFTRPIGTEEAIIALQDLASPVAAFVRDRCSPGTHEITVDHLWSAPGSPGARTTATKLAPSRPLEATCVLSCRASK